MTVHPIEAESYRILAERVDLSSLGPLSRVVTERVIHASADLEYAVSLVLDESALAEGVAALRRGAAVVADVEMVVAGITSVPVQCYLGRVPRAGGADATGPTRSAAAMRMAAADHPRGAVFVVGCAPTALAELVDLAGAGRVEPALVIGLPVGFVGAAESKEALRASGLPAVSNVGEKGGSAVAAAAVNALVRAAHGSGTGRDG
ncbi:MAG TPA: precorrin-8X methylmutase [Acidimicrobiales bacterium]|nr:precorrin-8X methylmutase [Acidimicrobiales bacterium]